MNKSLDATSNFGLMRLKASPSHHQSVTAAAARVPLSQKDQMLVDMLMSKRKVQVKSLAMKARFQPPATIRAQTKTKKTRTNFDFAPRPTLATASGLGTLSTNRKRMMIN